MQPIFVQVGDRPLVLMPSIEEKVDDRANRWYE